MRRARTLLALALLAAGAAGSGADDSLVLTVEADPGVGPRRGALEVLWLHREARGHWNAGVLAAEAASARWLLASVGGSRALGERWRLASRLRAGGGEDEGRRFDFGLAAVGLTYALRPAKLYLEGELLAYDVDRSRARLAKAGVLAAVGSRATFTLAYTATVEGDGDAEYLSVRLDLQGAHRTLFLGGTVGETVSALLDPGAVSPTAVDYRQLFVGVRRPGPRLTVDLALDFERVGGADRASLKLGLHVPLRRTRS